MFLSQLGDWIATPTALRRSTLSDKAVKRVNLVKSQGLKTDVTPAGDGQMCTEYSFIYTYVSSFSILRA